MNIDDKARARTLFIEEVRAHIDKLEDIEERADDRLYTLEDIRDKANFIRESLQENVNLLETVDANLSEADDIESAADYESLL